MFILISLIRVKKDEEAVLHNLMQFYIYEFNKYIPLKLEMNGSYKNFNLERYWDDPNYHAYFVKLHEEYIGFALVASSAENSPNVIEEFFIIQKYKGHGYGKEVAQNLFNMFPGKWRISQIEKNLPAKAFWRSVISNYTNGKFEESIDENQRTIQVFDTMEINQTS